MNDATPLGARRRSVISLAEAQGTSDATDSLCETDLVTRDVRLVHAFWLGKDRAKRVDADDGACRDTLLKR